MQSPSYGTMYPRSAYLLAIIGGIFILLGGLGELVAGIFLASAFESILPGFSGVVIAEGVLGLVFGAGVLLVALRLKSNPAASRTNGILLIVLALLSYLGGSGFFLGLILALIGGILAATWVPPVTPQPMYGQPGFGLPSNQPIATTQWGPPASPPLRPGTAQRFCASCGSPNVAMAQFCAKCGAPMA